MSSPFPTPLRWFRDEDGSAHGPAMSMLLLLAAVVSYSAADRVRAHVDHAEAQIADALEERAALVHDARRLAATGSAPADAGL